MLSNKKLKRFFASLPKDSKWLRQRAKPSFARKKQLVKNFWMVSGAIMLASQHLYAIAALALFTTILSFMFLYETP